MLKRLIYLLLDGLTSKLIGFFIFPFIASVYGPDLFGSLTYVLSLSFIFSTLATFGQSGTLVRDVSDRNLQIEAVVANYALLRITSTIISVIIYLTICFSFQHSILEHTLILYAIIFLICQSIYSFTISFMHGFSKTAEIVVLNQFVSVCSSSLKFLAATIKLSLHYFYISQLAATIAALFIIGVRYRHVFKKRKPKFQKDKIQKIFIESLINLTSALLTVLYLRVDIIMLRYLSTPIELGSYGLAVSLSEATWFIPAAAGVILTPILSNTFNAEACNKRYYNRASLFLFAFALLSIPFLSAYLLLSGWVSDIFSDRGFLKLQELLVILSLVIPIIFIANIIRILLIVERQTKYLLYSNICGLAINLTLNYLLIRKYGAIGAAYSTVISYFIANFLMYVIFDCTRIHIGNLFIHKSLYNFKIMKRLMTTIFQKMTKS